MKNQRLRAVALMKSSQEGLFSRELAVEGHLKRAKCAGEGLPAVHTSLWGPAGWARHHPTALHTGGHTCVCEAGGRALLCVRHGTSQRQTKWRLYKDTLKSWWKARLKDGFLLVQKCFQVHVYKECWRSSWKICNKAMHSFKSNFCKKNSLFFFFFF